jgi:hypothetical protein
VTVVLGDTSDETTSEIFGNSREQDKTQQQLAREQDKNQQQLVDKDNSAIDDVIEVEISDVRILFFVLNFIF